MRATLYHNPRCSKSRQTLGLLEERGLDLEVVHYLSAPPSPATLESILELLGREPRELMRTQEADFAKLGLQDPGLSRAALIQAMVDHPRLIERPILVTDRGARIGRPPEAVLEII